MVERTLYRLGVVSENRPEFLFHDAILAEFPGPPVLAPAAVWWANNNDMKPYLVLSGMVLIGVGLTAFPAKVQSPAPEFDAAFWKQWGDGQAELSGYDLTFPRYGHLRRGVAATIFVPEL